MKMKYKKLLQYLKDKSSLQNLYSSNTIILWSISKKNILSKDGFLLILFRATRKRGYRREGEGGGGRWGGEGWCRRTSCSGRGTGPLVLSILSIEYCFQLISCLALVQLNMCTLYRLYICTLNILYICTLYRLYIFTLHRLFIFTLCRDCTLFNELVQCTWPQSVFQRQRPITVKPGQCQPRQCCTGPHSYICKMCFVTAINVKILVARFAFF